MDKESKLEEAIPYQILMSSVLYKCVTGCLVESSPSLASRSGEARQKRRAP